MDHGIFRHWPIICLVAAAGFSAVVMKLVMRPSVGVLSPEDQSYEMLRPKSSTPGYDLSGRRVVREVHAIGGAAPTHPQLKPRPAPPAQTAAAKQSSAAKAQAEAKARAAKAQADKAKAAKVAAQKKAAEALAAAQAAQREAEAARWKDQMSPLSNNSGESRPVAANNGYSEPAPDVNSPNSAPNNDHPKMSPGQWRSLIHAQPSQKNAQGFLAAYHAGEVDAGTFYLVSQELLTDNAADRQAAGLYLLKQETAPRTFSLLVADYKDQLPESLKTKIYDIIKSYGEPSKFTVLNRVLLASDPLSVQMAAEILSQVVAAQTAVKTEATGRDSRSPGSTPIAVSSFQTFIPTLRRLASSQDASIAQKAQSLLESIQALKPV